MSEVKTVTDVVSIISGFVALYVALYGMYKAITDPTGSVPDWYFQVLFVAAAVFLTAFIVGSLMML